MSKELIYVVEDDIHIQQLLKYNLESNGYRVSIFDDGNSLYLALKSNFPDLFILDVMLPDTDGIEICRFLDRENSTKNIPKIMLTAKSEEFDRILGLEMGADDYITKPFSVRELLTRIKVVFRRISKTSITEEIIQCGDIKLDIDRHEIYKKDTLIELALKEFELLKLLIINKGKVLTRERLLEDIWGYDYQGETRTVDVHIRYLRQKIEDNDSNPIYIETVRGIGYRFNDKT